MSEIVQPPPQWLKDRMKRLKQIPPPTLEEVRIQFEASGEMKYEVKKNGIEPNIGLLDLSAKQSRS